MPDIRIDKKNKSQTGESLGSFSTKTGTYEKRDKRYLASVHIRFSDSKDATPLNFDISRDKQRLISAKLFQSEETVTTLGLGYTRDGPVAGLKFNWRF